MCMSQNACWTIIPLDMLNAWFNTCFTYANQFMLLPYIKHEVVKGIAIFY